MVLGCVPGSEVGNLEFGQTLLIKKCTSSKFALMIVDKCRKEVSPNLVRKLLKLAEYSV